MADDSAAAAAPAFTHSTYELTDEGAPLCKVHHKQHLDSTRRSSLCNSTPSIGGTFYLPDSHCMRCTPSLARAGTPPFPMPADAATLCLGLVGCC